jgi:hypothetical protein
VECMPSAWQIFGKVLASSKASVSIEENGFGW